MGHCDPAAGSAARQEAPMGSKDKGGRDTRKVAAKDLKQKRAEKRAKKEAARQSGITPS